MKLCFHPEQWGGAPLRTSHTDLQPPSKAQLKMGVKLCLFNKVGLSLPCSTWHPHKEKSLLRNLWAFVPRETQRQIGDLKWWQLLFFGDKLEIKMNSRVEDLIFLKYGLKLRHRKAKWFAQVSGPATIWTQAVWLQYTTHAALLSHVRFRERVFFSWPYSQWVLIIEYKNPFYNGMCVDIYLSFQSRVSWCFEYFLTCPVYNCTHSQIIKMFFFFI